MILFTYTYIMYVLLYIYNTDSVLIIVPFPKEPVISQMYFILIYIQEPSGGATNLCKTFSPLLSQGDSCPLGNDIIPIKYICAPGPPYPLVNDLIFFNVHSIFSAVFLGTQCDLCYCRFRAFFFLCQCLLYFLKNFLQSFVPFLVEKYQLYLCQISPSVFHISDLLASFYFVFYCTVVLKS